MTLPQAKGTDKVRSRITSAPGTRTSTPVLGESAPAPAAQLKYKPAKKPVNFDLPSANTMEAQFDKLDGKTSIPETPAAVTFPNVS